MEFAILGPVEARVGDRELALGGPKQRAVLAMLLLDANRPVSRDRLIDGLWGESPPPSAGHTLKDYVSRLRQVLGRDRIERRSNGYLIRVQPGELDLERFEALLEQGRAAASISESAKARDHLREALELWRGRALADLEHEPFAGEAAARLEERRLLALEASIAAELELGAGSELVGELERLVAEHPFRERFLAQLMLCFYRSGRQADALAAYQAGRRRFAEELGLEPGPELRQLERRILEQDATLAAPEEASAPAAPHPPKRRWLPAAALAALIVAAGAALGIELGIGSGSASSSGGPAMRVVDVNQADAPAAMAVDGGALWLAEPDAGAVVRVNQASHQVVQHVPVSGTPSAVTVGADAVWTASVPGNVVDRIDPASEGVTQQIRLSDVRIAALAFGLDRLWVADSTNQALLAIDPLTGRPRRTIPLDLDPTAIAVGAGAIWVADYNQGVLERIDPRSGSTSRVSVGNGPVAIAIGDGAIWVANSLDATVSKVAPATDDVAATTSVGSFPTALAISGRSVWVANQYSSSVSRIDARTARVRGTTAVDGTPTALTAAGGRIWVGTRSLAQHRGGTLVLLHTRPLALDPALQTDLPPMQSTGLTYDALLTYARTGGPQALLLVPDLALRVPTPTDDGMKYTFRLRRGIRYSDGRLVRASDFRRAIERLFSLRSPLSASYTRIVGATACTTKRCDLTRGIATDDASRTVIFHLRAPDPNFLSNMTSMATAPVPPGTPFHDAGTTPIPGTGPYIVAIANKHEIRYIRNPRFHEWSHAAQPGGNPDVIVMRYGLRPAQEVRAVERGQADWTADGIPASLQREVTTRFAAQIHRLHATETDFLQLNTTLPPFNDLRVRQALNWALDRAAIVTIFGGSNAARPTCQILPPGVLGYSRYCPYTRARGAGGRWRAPNLARARRLVAASGTRGAKVVVWGASDGPIHESAVVPYAVAVLRRLGYRARARLLPSSFFDHAASSLFRSMQVSYPGWADSTAYGFFGNWFLCNAQANHHSFCDPHLDAAIRKADTLEATNRRAAGILWEKIDRQLVDRAAWVPLVNPHWIDFVSRRVHNYEADPNLGLIADQVWLP